MGADVFEPGDRCGGYVVVHLLGKGGFAQVYEVAGPDGARRALKTLATDAAARPKLRARLAQEGTALAMIEHPNVVRLFEAGFHEDRVYLVIELVHGRSLREVIHAAGGRLDPAAVARWIRQAAEGVAAAHHAGVVHRDLKPENLLVADDDTLKVIDFGIAKLSSFGVRTTNAQRVGTALYMSPEQIQGRPPDARMDVYALGIVLYEALSGAHPIVSGPATVIEICARQLSYRPPPLAAAAPWVPPPLAALVDRAIEKDADRRLPSMRALADALDDALRRFAEAPTPVIATPSATALFGAFGTQVMPRVTAALPAATAPIAPTGPVAETAPFASPDPAGTTAPIAAPATRRDAPGAPGERPADELTTASPRAMPAPSRVGARDAAARAAVVVAALVIGIGGGVTIMNRIFAALAARAPAATSRGGPPALTDPTARSSPAPPSPRSAPTPSPPSP